MSAIVNAVILLAVIASSGCTRRSPLDSKLIGTWGALSIEGEIDYTYRSNHTWTADGAGEPTLHGHWRIEGNQLVSQVELPKEYVNNPIFADLRKTKREKIVRLSMKELVLAYEGREYGMERMHCPRCGTKLGTFETYQTMPSSRSNCPKCGLKLDDA